MKNSKYLLLVVILTAFVAQAWGADESVTFYLQGYSNGEVVESYAGTDFSILFDKGNSGNSPSYFDSGTAIRAYAKNTITISSSTKTISKIEFTFGSSDGSNAITAGTGTYSSGTWTGSATSVTFTIGGTSGNRRLSRIAITYEDAGPTITTSVTSLSDVGYNTTDFSQQVKSFTVSGSNLTNNVTITAPTNFEVCKTENGTYTLSVTFDKGSGTLSAQTVYVRLATDRTAGEYEGNISCTSKDATAKNVAISGKVPFTVTWKVNGTTYATTYVAYATSPGRAIGSLPYDPIPISYLCSPKQFYGWYDGASYSNASVAPTLITADTKITTDKTYNAVFATANVGATEWVETALSSLTASDIFVIVGHNSSGYYAMTNNNGTSSAPAATEVTISDLKITSEVASTFKWNISGNSSDGYIFYPNGSTTTWLYCTNTNNGVRVGTGTAKHFTLKNGYLYETETKDSRYIGIYNDSDWRCYTSTTGNIVSQTFSFYKKTGGTTYSDYATSCCTPLGAIKGSLVCSNRV